MRKIQNVIFGAGPNGLYLALKLVEQGVSIEQIIIFDPRHGKYFRPGHIDLPSLRYIKLKSGPLLTEEPGKQYLIKDVERKLYTLTQESNIQIENKAFICFSMSPQKIGVIIGTNEDQEPPELIECDYVYDCTGTKRVLINEINYLGSEKMRPPFVISPVLTHLPNTYYVIANIKMNESDIARTRLAISLSLEKKIFNQSEFEFTQHMDKLHALGWTREFYPLTKILPVHNEKVCFYSEAPNALSPTNVINWVQTVLTALTNSDIHIEPLKKSIKYGPKKDHIRITHFQLSLDYLNCYAYQAEGLPMVIPQGDAIQGPHFYLRQGIKYGTNRVNTFLQTLLINDGVINDFDLEKYHLQMEPFRIKQSNEQISFIADRMYYFFKALTTAELIYRKAIAQTKQYDKQITLERKHDDIVKKITVMKSLLDAPQIPSQTPALLTTEIILIKQEIEEKITHYATISIEFRRLKNIADSFYRQRIFTDAYTTYLESLKKFNIYAKKFPAEQQHALLFYDAIIKTYPQLSRRERQKNSQMLFEIASLALNQISTFFDTNEIKQNILLIVIDQLYKCYGTSRNFITEFQENQFHRQLANSIIKQRELCTPSLIKDLGVSARVIKWLEYVLHRPHSKSHQDQQLPLIGVPRGSFFSDTRVLPANLHPAKKNPQSSLNLEPLISGI